MPRFKIGDRIRILPTSPTPFEALQGTIDQVQPHDRDITILDRYTVVFDWGEKQSFFDAQLAHVKAPN